MEREFAALKRLDHPSIVGLIDVAFESDDTFLILDYFQNSLAEVIRRDGGLCWPSTREVIAEVLGALIYIHNEGVLHLDLKPENCMCVEDQGKLLSVKLVDFGLARLYERVSLLCRPTLRGGTPGYMAPERTTSGTCDERSDLYSVGAMMLVMLSGASLRNVHVCKGEVLGLARQGDERSTLCAFVDRLIAIDPDARFSTAREALRALLSLPDLALDPQRGRQAGSRRRWGAPVVATCLSVVFIALFVDWRTSGGMKSAEVVTLQSSGRGQGGESEVLQRSVAALLYEYSNPKVREESVGLPAVCLKLADREDPIFAKCSPSSMTEYLWNERPLFKSLVEHLSPFVILDPLEVAPERMARIQESLVAAEYLLVFGIMEDDDERARLRVFGRMGHVSDTLRRVLGFKRRLDSLRFVVAGEDIPAALLIMTSPGIERRVVASTDQLEQEFVEVLMDPVGAGQERQEWAVSLFLNSVVIFPITCPPTR